MTDPLALFPSLPPLCALSGGAMNVVKEIQRINERELELGISGTVVCACA
jgi:hypothetical protein